MVYHRLAVAENGNILQSPYNSDGDWVGPGKNPLGLLNVPITDVIEELVVLAAKHTNVKVEYRIFPLAYYNNQIQGNEKEHVDEDYGSVWAKKSGQNLDAFWEEFDRLKGLVTRPLDEPILEDDYPVYQGRPYVANGQVREFIDGQRMTVGLWKQLVIPGVPKVTEVRRCDREGRRARLPLRKEESARTGWLVSSPTKTGTAQKKRKPRSSNKIKKVQ